MGQQRPGHASHLVGKCHRHDLEGPPRKELREPEIFLRILLGAPQDGMRADDKNAPQVAVALHKLSADALKSESAYSPPGMAVKTVSDTNQC